MDDLIDMVHKYSIDEHKNILKEEFIGDINTAELDQANASITEDKKFKKGLNFLTDLRKAHLLISYEELVRHVHQLPGLAISKQAIIANHDLEYGISRQFEALTDDRGVYTEIRIFKDIDEAAKWLNS